MAKHGAPKERSDIERQQMIKETEQLKKQCDELLAQWHEAQADPGMVTINGFILDAKVSAIVDCIQKEFDISDEVFNYYYIRRVHKELTEGYQNFALAIAEARKEALSEALRPNQAEVTQLFGADGKPLRGKP